MRVLFVTHAFPRADGDTAGGFVLRLAVALRDVGVDVSVLAPAAPGLASHGTVEGIAVERFRYAPEAWETLAYDGTMAEQVAATIRGKLALAGMIAQGARAVSGAVARVRPAIVHAHWWFPSGLSCAMVARARPLMVTFHGSDIRLTAASRWAPYLFRAVMGRTATATAVSGWLAETARTLSPRAVEVAPMPVDVATFPAGEGRREPRILLVGRLNKQKGVRDVIDALRWIDPHIGLDVVGDGPDRDALKRFAEECGVGGRVRWHGALPQARVAPLYRAATVVAVPSVGEGLGLVAVEAQLSGTPVVAYRSGGLTDVVEHDRSGQLVEPGDVRSLARSLELIVTQPDRATAMGAEGRAAMLKRFSPAAVARVYADIYRAVAK